MVSGTHGFAWSRTAATLGSTPPSGGGTLQQGECFAPLIFRNRHGALANHLRGVIVVKHYALVEDVLDNFSILLGFHLGLVLVGNVTTKIETPPVPSARLRRMQIMFAKERGILMEDYQYFTRHSLPDAASPRNKAVRKLAKLN